MTKSIQLIIALILFISFTACENRSICLKGNGKEETREFEISDFKNVQLAESFNIRIMKGKRFIVKATGDDNILDNLEVDRIGNTCKIDFEKGCYRNYNIQIDITMPHLEQVFLDGSGDIAIYKFDSLSNLYLELNGSGNIELADIEHLHTLDAQINGSGSIRTISSYSLADNVLCEINGSGDFNAFSILTKNASIDISGSGSSRVNCSSYLDVNISGSGDVLFTGQPTIKQNITGSGRVIDAN